MNWLIALVILFLIGLGYAKILVRHIHGYNTALEFSIAPLLGAAILIIEGAFLATGSVSFRQLQGMAAATVLVSASILIKSMPSYDGFIYSLRISSWRERSTWLALFIIVILVATWLNPVHHNLLYVRLGIDMAGYVSATSEILQLPMSQPSLYLSNEILHNAHRWGLPILAALVHSAVPWQASIYETLFGVTFTMFVSGALSVGFVFSRMLSLSNGKHDSEFESKTIAYVIALAIVINSAQLNFINEGFYPQIMGTAMLSSALTIFMSLRQKNIAETNCWGSPILHAKNQIILLLAIFAAAIAITYSEAMILGLTFLAGCLLLDVIVFDAYRIKCDLVVVASFLLGLLIAFPVTKELIAFTMANSNNIGGIGYPQPSWMFPSELAGFGSIYADIKHYLDTAVATHIVKRTNMGLIVGSCASLVVVFAIYRAAIVYRDVNFVLTIVLGVLGFFVTNYWLSRAGLMPVNYAYNKLSSILSIMLTGLVVIGLWLGNPETGEQAKAVKFHRHALAIFLGTVFVTSIFTLKDSRNYSTNIDMQSIDHLNQQLVGCNCALLPTERGRRGELLIGKLRYVDRTADFYMSTMLPVPILDQWVMTNWFAFANDGTRVYFILRKDYVSPKRINMKRLVASSNTYLVLDARITVGELEKKATIEELAKWINNELSKE